MMSIYQNTEKKR